MDRLDSHGRLSQTNASLAIRVLQSAKEFEQLSGLLDRCFGLAQGQRFLNDFPVWDPKYSVMTQRWGAFDGERLVASAGMHLSELHTPTGRALSIAILGGVVTDSAYQGRGFATLLATQAVAWANSHGVAIILLWGSQHAMYRKMGFELCGHQTRLPLQALAIGDPPARWRDGYLPEIFGCVSARQEGVIHKSQDRGWFEAHKNVTWFTTGDSSKPFAFVGYGRGIDLCGMVHEWGGDPAGVRGLLSAIREKHPESEILASSGLIQRLGLRAPVDSPTEFLCMARILDPMKALVAFDPKPSLLISRSDGGWRVQSGVSEGVHFTDLELVRLFFGPLLPQSVKLGPLRLPFDLWIWGLDAA